MESTQLVILAGLVIGLVYGAVGLLSGFCLMSSMRGWLAKGDERLVRTYALAIAVAIAASQFLAGRGMVDLGKSIYLQQTFSAPALFLGGLLFGYGMVLSNGCGSRALVLLGRGNLRSFVVVIVLGIFAEMTLKGLIAPMRIAMVQASQATVSANSAPALLASIGLGAVPARMVAASVLSAVLIIFAFAHAPFRKSPGQIVAGPPRRLISSGSCAGVPAVSRDGRIVIVPVSNGATLYARYTFSYRSTLPEAKGARAMFEGVAIMRLQGGKITCYHEVANTAPAFVDLNFAPERIAKIVGKQGAALRARPEMARHLT